MNTPEEPDEPSLDWSRKPAEKPTIEAEQSFRGFIARLKMMFAALKR